MSNERAIEITRVFDIAPIEAPNDPKSIIEIQKAFIFFTSNNDHLFGVSFFQKMVSIVRFRHNFQELIKIYNEIEQTKLDYATLRVNNEYLTLKGKILKRIYFKNWKEVLETLKAVQLEINYEEAVELGQLEANKEKAYDIFKIKKKTKILK